MNLAQLHQAIVADPDPDAPRLAYAEEADRRGDPRGALIRLQIRYREARRDGSMTAPLGKQIRALITEHGESWIAPVAGRVDDARLLRGFVEEVTLAPDSFPARATELFEQAPIRHLRLRDAGGRLAELAASPHLARLVSLSAWGCGLTNDDLRALAGSPHARRLRVLDLGDNRITRAGVEVLCASPHLVGLIYVNLQINLVENPVERFSVFDHAPDRIVPGSAELPQLGKELEQAYGPQPWLHAPSLSPVFPVLPVDV